MCLTWQKKQKGFWTSLRRRKLLILTSSQSSKGLVLTSSNISTIFQTNKSVIEEKYLASGTWSTSSIEIKKLYNQTWSSFTTRKTTSSPSLTWRSSTAEICLKKSKTFNSSFLERRMRCINWGISSKTKNLLSRDWSSSLTRRLEVWAMEFSKLSKTLWI